MITATTVNNTAMTFKPPGITTTVTVTDTINKDLSAACSAQPQLSEEVRAVAAQATKPQPTPCSTHSAKPQPTSLAANNFQLKAQATSRLHKQINLSKTNSKLALLNKRKTKNAKMN